MARCRLAVAIALSVLVQYAHAWVAINRDRSGPGGGSNKWSMAAGWRLTGVPDASSPTWTTSTSGEEFVCDHTVKECGGGHRFSTVVLYVFKNRNVRKLNCWRLLEMDPSPFNPSLSSFSQVDMNSAKVREALIIFNNVLKAALGVLSVGSSVYGTATKGLATIKSSMSIAEPFANWVQFPFDLGREVLSLSQSEAYDMTKFTAYGYTPDIIIFGHAGGVFDIGHDGIIRSCWTAPCFWDGSNYDGSQGPVGTMSARKPQQQCPKIKAKYHA